MKTKLTILLSIFVALATISCNTVTDNAKDMKLWYDQPAKIWEEALPLGNGSFGAMVFGDPLNEFFQMNEETLWSGPAEERNNPNAPAALPLIREAINNGEYREAEQLWRQNSQGPYSARYLPMANLILNMSGSNDDVEGYYRDLNISNATSTVSYILDETKFRRTAFISYPDQVMVIKLESDKRGALSFDVGLNSDLRYTTTADGHEIILKGKAPYYVAHRNYDPNQILYSDTEDGSGLNFAVKLNIIPKGGKTSHTDSTLIVNNADEVIIIMAAATSSDMSSFSSSSANTTKAFEIVSERVDNAESKGYKKLLSNHLDDYKTLFDRVELNLGDGKLDLPTNKRLASFQDDDTDYGLVSLYYQLGRYLTIAGSRAGGLPTNLQGIWNRHVQPPWGCNYTTNINTEMNYWPTETTGLAECAEPLLSFIERLSVEGAKTAKINYDIDNGGWLAHHNSDAWAQTSPAGWFDQDPASSARWSCWPLAGAWFSQHLWEHYAFGGNIDFLQSKAYPIMKGAALFMLEWLQDDEETGYVLTNPSSSPENSFRYIGKDGKPTEGVIAKGSTMDMTIIRNLFDNCIKASEALSIDEEFRNQLINIMDRLLPPQMGAKGQLQEWHKDFEDIDPRHRHVSHLLGLHPGNEVLPRVNPEYAKAAKRTLEIRGDGGTGWAMAWKINFWARLEDGNHAYKMLRNGMRHVDATDVNMRGGGTYSNLLDAHPPFQIDGNFGGTAGITEMLLQSHADEIHLLPALPDAWSSGSVKGLRARGGFVLDFDWENGAITNLVVNSTLGGNCRIRTGTPLLLNSKELIEANGDNPNQFYRKPYIPTFVSNQDAEMADLPLRETKVYDFDTAKGNTYKLSAK